MKVGIAGYGVLGHALERALSKGGYDICIYDKYDSLHHSEDHKRAVSECDLTFIAVPTREIQQTGHCDISEVEDCLTWIKAPVCIKSTIPPGTVDELSRRFNRLVAFSPEYLGEQPDHPWTEIDSAGFIIVGGSQDIQEIVIRIVAPCIAPETQIYRSDAKTAELCKYMDNCFLATKVAFVNQFYEIACKVGVAFEELTRIWLLDPRIGESHTRVTADGGFGGRCLPKDLRAMIASMRDRGGAPLLEAVSHYNEAVRSKIRSRTGSHLIDNATAQF